MKTKLLGLMALVPMCLALRVGAANATTFNWTNQKIRKRYFYRDLRQW